MVFEDKRHKFEVWMRLLRPNNGVLQPPIAFLCASRDKRERSSQCVNASATNICRRSADRKDGGGLQLTLVG